MQTRKDKEEKPNLSVAATVIKHIKKMAAHTFWNSQGNTLFGTKVPDGVLKIAKNDFPTLLTLRTAAEEKLAPTSNFDTHRISSNLKSLWHSATTQSVRKEATENFYHFVVNECTKAIAEGENFDLKAFKDRIFGFYVKHDILYQTSKLSAPTTSVLIETFKTLANDRFWDSQGFNGKAPKGIQYLRNNEIADIPSLLTIINAKLQSGNGSYNRKEATTDFYDLIKNVCQSAIKNGDDFSYLPFIKSIEAFCTKYSLALPFELSASSASAEPPQTTLSQ